jgi:hypothetical protein
MTVLNSSFETGTNGAADNWTHTASTTLADYANFTDTWGYEPFDWFDWESDLGTEGAGYTTALFDTSTVITEGYEDFEDGWGAVAFLDTLTGVIALFDTSYEYDGFELWYTWATAIPGNTLAVFSGDDYEDFDYGVTWESTMLTEVIATFDSGTYEYEDFDDPAFDDLVF